MKQRYDEWKLTDTHKWCNPCKTMKRHEDFSPSSKTKSGLQGWCKACVEGNYYKRRAEKAAEKEARESGKRLCSRNGCQTKLSRYNMGEYCSVHERLGAMNELSNGSNSEAGNSR